MHISSLISYSGRIDRKIEFPLPNEKTRRRIFQIHTKKMTLAKDLDLEEYITAKDDLSGADIKVIFIVCSCIYLNQKSDCTNFVGTLYSIGFLILSLPNVAGALAININLFAECDRHNPFMVYSKNVLKLSQ